MEEKHRIMTFIYSKVVYFLFYSYLMGLIPTRWDLSLVEKVTASCFCRRRLPVVMVKSKFPSFLLRNTYMYTLLFFGR